MRFTQFALLGCLVPWVALPQGSLTPPAAPGPTFRSLLDVEPRYPIYHYGTNLMVAGSYYLATNLVSSSTSVDGLTVGTNNVTIDFNGFSVINLAGSSTGAEGVMVGSRRNVTLQNGTVMGFIRGIVGATGFEGLIIENMRLITNYSRGISLAGVDNASGGAIIRNNFILHTGGTATGAGDQDAQGIYAITAAYAIENNVIAGVSGKGNGAGYGIWVSGSVDAFVINNRISRANYGMRLNGVNEYRDNLTSSCDTNYLSGTDRGNNY